MRNFEFGDFVEIKAKALEYNPFLKKIGRLSGEITDVSRLKNQIFYTVDLDAESLNKLPEEYIIQNYEEDINNTEINVLAEDLIFKKSGSIDYDEIEEDEEYDEAYQRIIDIEERVFYDDAEDELTDYERDMIFQITVFIHSEYFNKLTKKQKEHAGEIVTIFSKGLYSEMGVKIGDAEIDDIKEIIFEDFIRTLTAPKDFYKACAPVLIKFFEFMKEQGMVENIDKQIVYFKKNATKIVEQGMDPTYWGPAKTLGMQAVEQGIDLTNPKEIKTFVDRYNEEIERQNIENESIYELPDLNWNDKVTVKYTDGRVMMNIKYKKVMDDIKAGKCIIINSNSNN